MVHTSISTQMGVGISMLGILREGNYILRGEENGRIHLRNGPGGLGVFSRGWIGRVG